MMATAGPPSTFGFLPLLETLEDSTAGQSEQTDAYLTIANRLSGEEGRQFLPTIEKHFSRLGTAVLGHVTSPNAELSQAALQALGFCVYHSHVISGVSEVFASHMLSALCSLVTKSTDKNTCTRALWVISKQSFPPDIVGKKVPAVLMALQSVLTREEILTAVIEHEALNVIVKMLEQVPIQMGNKALHWVRLVVPLVVHPASKVRLRAAAALEMGMPLLMAKQTEVAAVIEPMMSSILIAELQKLFKSKNEMNVLKLWPLFVKLLGKLLHRGGPFINSLLHLEELGFRSSSPTVKKIAFIAWKSLIDNFALNPDILCSSKRMKLLMQPLLSIHVRTEALLLTKVEVWWYLVVQLGPNLSSNFDQVSVPLFQSTIGLDSSSVAQNGAVAPNTPKSAGSSSFNSSVNTPRMNLNSSMQVPTGFPSIQLLGLEMLLHYFLGPEVVAAAAKNNITLSLEPLNHPLLSGASSFMKHAAVLISNIRDGFINIGKEAPESLLAVIWTNLVRFVNLTIESGSKKDRQGCEVLTLMLQALQSIVASEVLSADKVLVLFEATVKGLPQRVLGSASYQVGKMDVLNGTPSLFIILLLFNSCSLPAYADNEKFFHCLQTLVACGLRGPTSPLAFAEAVLGAISNSAGSLQNKEQLWRMWSLIVSPLTDHITQSNEVNQGDALEHNFSAMHSALMFPVTHLLPGTPLQQPTQKSMLSSWTRLYKVFARCSSLVVTAEENICCEELCTKMMAAVDREALAVPSTLNAVTNILHVIVECVDFSPYTPYFQQKMKSPHTPVNWTRKRSKTLGNLSTFHSLLVQCLQIYLQAPEASSEATGSALVSILSNLFANLVLPNAVQEALNLLIQPLTLFYKQAASDTPTFASHLLEKLEKLLGKVLGCMQTCSTLAYNEELLALLSPLLCVLFPHKNKNLRVLVTQFWNATFSNSVSLTYPEEIRPILSQVKQRTPIILPGFEVVSVPDELSGTYSSESSQMETKLSGMPVSSAGKRDSLLDRVTEPKNKSSTKSVSTKLDFGSPKIPHRKILEEEASVDFVFIPPETKERVLTEHQKEVKRTKRVDIPAMYNNLDASLDTTVFTQYTQSQEDSLDKVPTQEHGSASVEVIQIDEEMDEVAEVLTKENQDYSSPKPDEKMTKNTPQEEVVPDPADVSMEDHKTGGERVEDVDMECKDKTSPNTSASSDLVSGTPQKPSSRRQSFITLEKYDEGKSASPSGVSSTTGLLVKSSNSQDLANTTKTLSSESPQSFTGLKAPGSAQMEKCSPQCPEGESPRRPKDSRTTHEPVRLIERLPRRLAEDDDVIPDTQTEGQESSVVAGETKSSSQEEESEQMLDDSQSSLTQMSPDEVRRSGRHRVRPQLPGEDPKEREAKYTQFKRRRSGEDLQSESPKTTQTKPNTRSKQVAEEDNRRDGLRSRSQGSLCESSQTNSRGKSRKMIRLFSNSEDFLNYSERKRRSIGELESSQTDSRSETLSGHEGQMQKRRGRPSKTSKKADDETEKSKEESSQALIEDFVELTDKQNGRPKTDSQTVVFSPQTDSKPQEIDSVEKTEDSEKQEEESKAASPEGEDHVQEKIGFQVVVSSPTNESQDQTNKLESEEIIKDKCTTVKSAEENFSQDDSQVTPSSADSLSKRRSRRSKASSEAAESEDKGDGMSVRWLRSSQGSASVSHSDGETGGRTRRRKGSESSAGSTPDRSQSLKSSKLESSQSRGRYSRLRSSPASAASFESSESESSEVQEISPVPIKRGRRPRASLPSPLTLESKEEKCDTNKANASPETDIQSSEAKANIEELSEAPVTSNLEDLTNKESLVTTETQDALTMKTVTVEKMETDHTKQSSESPDNTQSKSKTDGDSSFSLEIERLDPVGLSKIQTQESGLLAEDALVPPGDKLMAADPSEKKAEEVAPDNLIEDLDSDHQEGPIVSGEEPVQGGHSQSQVEQVHVIEEEEQSASNHLSETCAEKDIPPQEDNKNSQTKLMEDEQEKNATSTEHLDAALPDCNISGSLEAPVQDFPVKQTVLEAGPASDIGQSPNSERARGTWSPSASPSTSILKKGQKRPLEVEVTSPLVKCRRVSFANPIQHQETADDIDRRSPAVRTSSPRRSKVGNVPPLKHITTPTKGAVIMSPRNLHSPGYRSSKKCLISEMSQEPRAVPRDCICPALVGCSAPVEAVLPQISSTMWSRGFGQLVRARNIKTVGDLSALTPTEIKTLPIRSPKISNVKKALKIYEQQRKGRGGDELKSFDETEMMTSELEETNALQNPDEKTSGETLATELVDEPFPAEVDATAPQTPSSPDVDQRAEEALRPAGLLSAVGLLDRRMSLPELGVCSPQQLVEMHEQLGGMMRRVVIELQTRLSHAEDEQ